MGAIADHRAASKLQQISLQGRSLHLHNFAGNFSLACDIVDFALLQPSVLLPLTVSCWEGNDCIKQDEVQTLWPSNVILYNVQYV